MSAVPAFRLLIGLGNPGREYAETRHNVGFCLLDRLLARDRAQWKSERPWRAQVARLGALWLCKPQTYMNLSGESVQPMAQFHKIEPAQILVILDDLALPLGRLRLRPAGSSGGHKGLQSIIERLGTKEIPRLRIGIGASGGNTVDYVLGRFAMDEREPLEQALDRATQAIDTAQAEGFAMAMNRFNLPSTP